MANDDFLWRAKLAARLHDPAEKALVLMRDPAGHENGTSRALARLLGLFETKGESIAPDTETALSTVLFRDGLPTSLHRLVKRADWWASAADRPQFPMREVVTGEKGHERVRAVAEWAQVRWTEEPVLTHPLTGETFKLAGGLWETAPSEVKERSRSHFKHLIESVAAHEVDQDLRKVLLAVWRFGPDLEEEKDSNKLGELWKLLPADTRIPDHSIWDHLDLVSAFAGAFAADPEGVPALLALSIGPVQSFIAAARKTDDLWAGSHLLSRLAWEVMKPICERLGPDAILFPRLRGIAQVDLWLQNEIKLPEPLFEKCDWRKAAPDANPLFAAALPNRLVAIVPASQVEEITAECRTHVREWLLELGLRTVDRLLEEADLRERDSRRDESIPAYQQVREQLKDFPEVHWASVSFSLIQPRDLQNQTDLDVSELKAAMAPFYGVRPDQPSGFLKSSAWEVLSKEITWEDGTKFFDPNPGVLYPAVYELTERLLAAAKSVRPFKQSRQEGWRCSLTGETEWLTTDWKHLSVPKGKRKSRTSSDFRDGEHVETLWTKVAEKRPAWAKEGEHLGALPAIKRLWPSLFVEEVKDFTEKGAERFAVSTHTMALAYQFQRWIQRGAEIDLELVDAITKSDVEPVALPRRLIRQLGRQDQRDFAKRIPSYLEKQRDSGNDQAFAHARGLITRALLGGKEAEKTSREGVRLETYYALVLMDGDRMGSILSGDAQDCAITFLESFHPSVKVSFEQLATTNSRLRDYARERRPVSPNRHLAISSALNDFSQIIVPHVIEEEHLGRLIYAGGDDVLAMLPVAEVLSAIQCLRDAYRGETRDPDEIDWGAFRDWNKLACKNGFASLNGRLMRMMGRRATTSCGVVIAHHQAPLSSVLRELREAESKAKNYRRPKAGAQTREMIDRDACHITVIKRSGGALNLSVEWGEPLDLLGKLRDFLADPAVSRRAVYHTLEWLVDLPGSDPREPLEGDMLEKLLAYQMARQATKKAAKKTAIELARRLTELTMRQPRDKVNWLTNYLTVAEFLARETRVGGAE
jgi:CRISPR-associated protein Cmr2